MNTLTLTLPPEIWRRLKKKAEQAGQLPETVAQDLLIGQLSPLAEETEREKTARILREASPQIGYRSRIWPMPVAQPETEREKLTRLLREAGVLSEIGPRMRQLVETTTVNHDEVVTILARAGGKPLSEIVLEQRGPKG